MDAPLPHAADLQRLARLARLPLDAAEAEALARDVGVILGHLEVLRRADDALDVPPREPAAACPLRADRPGDDPLLTPPAELAPAWADGYFLVPRLPGMGSTPPADG